MIRTVAVRTLLLGLSVFATMHPGLGLAVNKIHDMARRQNENPAAAGNPNNGWQTLPEPVGATRHDWEIGSSGVNMPLLQSNDNPDQTRVKRAVIVLTGKPRDCWMYFNTIHNALIQASEKDLGVSIEEVSILAPCFLAEIDRVGAANPDDFTFGLTTWASGHYSVGPENATRISAYEVLDELVSYYMNRDLYPNLNAVVVGGHSLGSQMAQRYAVMRKVTDNDDRLHYWVANPGSLLWLTEDRPQPEYESGCDSFDDFKYGLAGNFPGYALSDTNSLGRDGLVERYRNRKVHYAWGLNDHGNGDTRCQARTQGDTHLERGQNYDAMLHNMSGGMPAAQTIDYVEGVSHQVENMMYSDEGIDKLFVLSYNSTQ